MAAPRLLRPRAQENSTGQGSYPQIQMTRLTVTPRTILCRGRQTLLNIMSGLNQGRKCKGAEVDSLTTSLPTTRTQCATAGTGPRTVILTRMGAARRNKNSSVEIMTKSHTNPSAAFSRNLTSDKTGLPEGGRPFPEFLKIMRTRVDWIVYIRRVLLP